MRWLIETDTHSSHQCCVEITGKKPRGDSYCRGVSNNECSGGEFSFGYYPGDIDIQC